MTSFDAGDSPLLNNAYQRDHESDFESSIMQQDHAAIAVQESSDTDLDRKISVDSNDIEIGLSQPTRGESHANAASEASSAPTSKDLTIGGPKAHIFRRVYHVIIISIVPWLYYWYFDGLSDAWGISAAKLLSIVIIVQMVGEALRIWKGFVCFGLRTYEAKQISAQAWGTCGMCLVFLMAPYRYPGGSNSVEDMAFIGLPITWGLAFIDPLVGELKNAGLSVKARSAVATVVDFFIWLICYFWLGTPWFLCLILPPISIAAEYPSLKAIDDNGMMLLVPLVACLILQPFF